MKDYLYKTSKSGARMERTEASFIPFVDVPPPFAAGGQPTGDVEDGQLRIDAQVAYQRFQGFGASAQVDGIAFSPSPQRKRVCTPW